MLIREGGYIVSVSTGGAATITAADDGASFAPVDVLVIDGENESANVAHDLIDGSVAVTLVGDRPQTGELVLLFDNDIAMTTARSILGRRTSFVLDVPQRPVLNMTFVRDGVLRPGMHDEVRNVWEFSVGFREVTP